MSADDTASQIADHTGLTIFTTFKEFGIYHTVGVTCLTAALLFLAFELPHAYHLSNEASEKVETKLRKILQVHSDAQFCAQFIDPKLPADLITDISGGFGKVIERNTYTNGDKKQSITPIYNFNVFVELTVYDSKYFLIDWTVYYKKPFIYPKIKFCCSKQQGPYYEKELFDKNYEFTWVFLPAKPDHHISESQFKLLSVSIGSFSDLDAPDNNLPVKLIKENDINKITYQAQVKPTTDIIAEDKYIKCRFQVLQARDYAAFSVGAIAPTKDFSVKVDASKLPINDLHYFSAFSSENYPSGDIDHQGYGPIKHVRVDGWCLIGSNIIFSWNEQNDRRIHARESNPGESKAIE